MKKKGFPTRGRVVCFSLFFCLAGSVVICPSLLLSTHRKADPKLGADFELLDTAVGKVATHIPQGDHHDAILDKVLSKDPSLLALGKHYNGPDFARHAMRFVSGLQHASSECDTDAVIVGGGLAGLTAALVLLDSGAHVTIVEREAFMGGNSAKASSGINGVAEDKGLTHDGDTMEQYKADVLKSGGFEETFPLLDAFIKGAGEAVSFLTDRVGMDLDKVVQMGGHSKARTYRPSQGMAGAEITTAVNALIENFVREGKCRTMKKTKVVELVARGGKVGGVVLEDLKSNERKTVTAPHVILATGGYAFGGPGSLLEKHRPDLAAFPTTNGKWANGGGHLMAAALDANMVHMEDVQVHPTGFIDPKNPTASTKTLSAELLRGMGGVLLLGNGSRFVNELGTRAHITEAMLASSPQNLSFTLVVHEGAAVHADKHIPIYEQKGLMAKHDTLGHLASHLEVSAATLAGTVSEYNAAAAAGVDAFGKTHFNNVPIAAGGYFFAGQVTPVVHYTMGGLEIDERARVKSTRGQVIEGLYAAGEITGGLHGRNRLGGNALTECVVFGRIAAEDVVKELKKVGGGKIPLPRRGVAREAHISERVITAAELSEHNTKGSLWVALHGKVYDLTDFVDDHPAGPGSIRGIGGKDGTKPFSKIHSKATLKGFKSMGAYKG